MVATTEPPQRIRSSTPSLSAIEREQRVWTLQDQIVWQPQYHDDRRNSYFLRGVVVGEGEVMWPPNAGVVEEFYSELWGCDARGEHLPQDTVRAQLFKEIDRLIAVGKVNEAVCRLVELSEAAFLVVDWEAKRRYLEVVSEHAVGESREAAIVAIFKSLQSNKEIEAALEVLRRKGKR